MKTYFSVCPLNGWHAREGGSSRTHKFESTRGRKTQGNHFTRMWLGQYPYCNCNPEFVLLHDPQILSPQSPTVPVSRLVLGIGPQIGIINYAPKLFRVNTCTNNCHLHDHVLSPPLYAHRARTILGYRPETVYRYPTTYVTSTEEKGRDSLA